MKLIALGRRYNFYTYFELISRMCSFEIVASMVGSCFSSLVFGGRQGAAFLAPLVTPFPAASSVTVPHSSLSRITTTNHDSNRKLHLLKSVQYFLNFKSTLVKIVEAVDKLSTHTLLGRFNGVGPKTIIGGGESIDCVPVRLSNTRFIKSDPASGSE